MLIIYNKTPQMQYIKYTFISNREIIGYIKIMTSRATLLHHTTASSEQEKICNFWLLTTNTNHFQLIFEGKLDNNTDIFFFGGGEGKTNCHTSCIIMSVKKSKQDLAIVDISSVRFT